MVIDREGRVLVGFLVQKRAGLPRESCLPFSADSTDAGKVSSKTLSLCPMRGRVISLFPLPYHFSKRAV
jgi:hypothetical protein